MLFSCVQAQKWLIIAVLSGQAALSDAMEMVNQASKLLSTIALDHLHANYFRGAWQFLGRLA